MAITFHQVIPSWSGTSGSGGVASASFTPNSSGDTLLIFGADTSSTGKTITFSSSASTSYTKPSLTAAIVNASGLTQIWVQGPTDTSDNWGQTVTPGFSLACSAGSQTASVKSSTTTDGVAAILLDYSGVGAVNVGLVSVNTPATLEGPAIGVPSGYTLVALCWCPSSANAITASNGTSRATGTMNGGAYCISEFSGTGVTTPAWTQSGSSTQNFDFVYWFLTPSGGVQPIYVVQSVQVSESTGPWSCTLPNTTTVGNVIVASLAGGGGGGAATPFPLVQFNDNQNGGGSLAYTQFNPVYNSSLGMYGVHGYVKVATAGSTTVTISGTNETTGFVSAYELGGFGSNIPTVDSGASVNATGSGTTQTLSISTAHNFEVLFCAPWNTGAINVAVPDWNAAGSGTVYDNNYYAPLSAPQANNFSGTLGSSTPWLSVGGGIYSAPSAYPTPSAHQFSFASLGGAGALAPLAPFAWVIKRRMELAKK